MRALTALSVQVSVGAPRRLPSVPLPEARESLPSWVNRIGLAYGVRSPDLRAALGLTDPSDMKAWISGLDLTTSAIGALSSATGVCGEAIRTMLLSRFTATALPNLPRAPYGAPGKLTAWTVGAWVLRQHSNFCPNCVAENGRWRLEWKLPWSFACLDHLVYLRNSCPRCKLPQRGPGWGQDSRTCRLRISAPDLQHPDHAPYGASPPGLCGARLDQDGAIPVTDSRVLTAQQRLMRWLYETVEDSARETEFASLTALAAQRLTPAMLRGAGEELHSAICADDDSSEPQRRPPELSPVWADPLRMAGAARAAQRLTASGYRPELAIDWLTSTQTPTDSRFVLTPGQHLYGTSLVFGPFHHDTAHMRTALQADFVSLPYQGPAYINSLSPYRVHPVPPAPGTPAEALRDT
ncbi:TniQ family protein [Streptomyces tendae]|uniref:TniQ family protein n=1 Tax=Streptomyces tendae TaxID=1932 RepID=UPI0037A9E851